MKNSCFRFRYNCIFPKKKLTEQADLDSESYDSITDSLTVSCQLNGTYDIDIHGYACTKVCPYPSNPDPEIYEISMNATVDDKPEIFDTVSYWCKDDKKLVSKVAFATGEPTRELDSLTSTCLISGWLNETIGSYACTQDCIAPVNYTETLNYDYVVNGSTTIGTEVR